jgi:hypothetical protein
MGTVYARGRIPLSPSAPSFEGWHKEDKGDGAEEYED